MNFRHSLSGLAAMFAATLPLAAAHAAPAVTNGSFESFTPGTNGLATVSGNNLTGWTTTSNYTLIVNANQANNGFNDGYTTTEKFWGVVTASPDGGNFLANDAPFGPGVTSTVVTGLVTGATYAVSFYMAGAQEYGSTGATTDKWTVGFGNSYATSTFKDSTTINLASQSFSGWVAQSLTFVAAGTSAVLSFMATGTPSGQPPFALLDGVTVTQVPEPPAYGLLAVGLLGLLGIRRARRQRG